MKQKTKMYIAIAIAAVVLAVILIPAVTKAACEPHVPAQCCFRAEDNCGQYESLGDVTISAYYPGEYGYTVNFKGETLADQVGWQVAVPTGSDLLGKWIYIDGVGYRKCWNTGCKQGRIDLLVGDRVAMNEWGLRECEAWILEGFEND